MVMQWFYLRCGYLVIAMFGRLLQDYPCGLEKLFAHCAACVFSVRLLHFGKSERSGGFCHAQETELQD